MSDDLTLGQLLDRAISTAFRVSAAPSANDASVQKQLQECLSDLTLCSSLIAHLGVLSPNETLDDINTRDLRCILVDGLRGEMLLLLKTTSGKERIANLSRAQERFLKFNELVERYEVIPEAQRGVFAGPQAASQDPAKRRESKIAQYKMEKQIKSTLEELRTRKAARRTRATASASTSTSQAAASSEEVDFDSNPDDLDYDSDDDDTEVSRPLFVNLILLHYIRSHADFQSIGMELELLNSHMAMSDLPDERSRRQIEDGRGQRRDGEEEDGTWKVEQLSGRQGPLLDKAGKVLRPFTILPSSNNSGKLSTRLRFQEEVFRPGHRLPTMTIDEFLDQEQAQGNILQGGGPSTSEEVDQARRDEQAEKEDDTIGGYEREERELRKIREQDEWKDTHRKGEGNMHNRG